ncbi:MAG: histidine kinase [Cyclobacteriaceae bacterium]|nr:histidine kinase [Cyclobacteriaceae bacterium]
MLWLRKMAYNPFVIAMIITGFTAFFLPQFFDRYQISLLDREVLEKDKTIYYKDLDQDGTPEMIRMIQFQSAPAVEFRNLQNRHIYTWNFKNEWIEPNKAVFGDYNRDGFQEIYVFTQSGDSVFVNGFQLYPVPTIILDNFFITCVAKHNNKNDFSIIPAGLADVSGDDYHELIFAITAHFVLQPRQLFAVDIHNHQLIHSPPTGIHFNPPLSILNGGEDGTGIIVASNSATNNIKDIKYQPYHDGHSWILLFGKGLELTWDPIALPGPGSFVQKWPVNHQGNSYILCLYQNVSSDTTDCIFYTYDARGNLLKSVTWQNQPGRKTSIIPAEPGMSSYLMVSGGSDEVHHIDHELNIEYAARLKAPFRQVLAIDAAYEWPIKFLLSHDNFQEVYVADHQFRHFSNTLVLNADFSRNTLHCDLISHQPNTTILSLQAGNSLYLLKIGRNPWYDFKYILLLAIFLAVAALIFTGKKMQSLQDARKRHLEERINRLQMNAAASQLDPHFTFNAINSIGTVILESKNEEAYSHLLKFSKLMRISLENADKISYSLAEELQFVRHYLELEKIRYKDRLDYTIEVDYAIDQSISVPKMIIQIHAENAIKHGLRPKRDQGYLSIRIFKKGRKISIIVEDNGVGRKAASDLNHSKIGFGKGLKITEEMIHLFNKIYGRDITRTFEDLFVGENASGTRICIQWSL